MPKASQLLRVYLTKIRDHYNCYLQAPCVCFHYDFDQRKGFSTRSYEVNIKLSSLRNLMSVFLVELNAPAHIRACSEKGSMGTNQALNWIEGKLKNVQNNLAEKVLMALNSAALIVDNQLLLEEPQSKPSVQTDQPYWFEPNLPPTLVKLAQALEELNGKARAGAIAEMTGVQPSVVFNRHKSKWGHWLEKYINRPESGIWQLSQPRRTKKSRVNSRKKKSKKQSK